MQLNVFNDTAEAVNSLAEFIIKQADNAISERNRFSIALSGGSSPKRLYELLSADFYKKQIEWNKVFFFFGDERNVPQNDSESNYLMAKKALFDPLDIENSQVFAVDTALKPEEAALKYTNDVSAYFGESEWRFDLVLLGLGDDSHTASLFPFTTVLKDQVPAVKAVFLPEKQVFRITMNAPLINLAHQIAFLVYGDSKAEAVHHVMEDDRNTEKFPAQLIAPDSGKVNWFLDDKAIAKLKNAGK